MTVTLSKADDPKTFTLTIDTSSPAHKITETEISHFSKQLDLNHKAANSRITCDGSIITTIREILDKIISHYPIADNSRDNLGSDERKFSSPDVDSLIFTLEPDNKTESHNTDQENDVEAPRQKKYTITVKPKTKATHNPSGENYHTVLQIVTSYNPKVDKAIRNFFDPGFSVATYGIIISSSLFSILSIIPFFSAAKKAQSTYPPPFFNTNYTNITKEIILDAEIAGSTSTNVVLNGYYLSLVESSILLFYQAKKLNALLKPNQNQSYTREYLENGIYSIFSLASALPFYFLSRILDKLPCYISIPTLLVYTALHLGGIKFVGNLILSLPSRAHYLWNQFHAHPTTESNQGVAYHELRDDNTQSFDDKENNRVLSTEIDGELALQKYLSVANSISSAKNQSAKSNSYYIVYGLVYSICNSILLYGAKCAIEGYGYEVVENIKKHLIDCNWLAISAFVPFICIIIKVAHDQAMAITKFFIEKCPKFFIEKYQNQSEEKKHLENCPWLYYSARVIIFILAMLSPGPALLLNKTYGLGQQRREIWAAIIGTALFNASAAFSVLDALTQHRSSKIKELNENRARYLK